jgi:hypothetical protein
MNQSRLRIAARRLAVGLYGCWLLAVVLTMAGRFTAAPQLETARLGMIVGGGVFTLIGSVQILRNLGERVKKEL